MRIEGFTIKFELGNPETVPSVTVIFVVSAFFKFVTSAVEDRPVVKLTAVVYTGEFIALPGPENVRVLAPV